MKSTGRAPRRSRLAAAAAAVAVAASVVACGGSGSNGGTPTPTLTPQTLAGAFEYEGVDHVSWWHDQYRGAQGSDSRQALAATGASWAGVLVTWYVAIRDATAIEPDAQRTPANDALIETIRDLRGRGLKVMLKPHVDSKDDTWRGQLTPSDTNAWFASYADYVVGMARLAEQEHVEMLCVGTELKTLSSSSYQGKWADIIAAVRAVYGGKLTYAANANNLTDEFKTVSFWSLLDVAGLDAYVPLTTSNSPTRGDLVAGWSQGPSGDMLGSYRAWAGSHGKPVIFTEIGYRSLDGANRAPWEFSGSGAYDPAEQNDCYYAAFAVFLPERSWMRGIFWWDWPVPMPSASDLDYTPRNKPAGAFLAQRYAAS